MFSCSACHPQLLTDDMNIVSYLAMPLAGPEDYDDEEMDRLPPDLQYLPPDKTREEDPTIRTMLLESLMQVEYFLANAFIRIQQLNAIL